jgi:TIR domain
MPTSNGSYAICPLTRFPNTYSQVSIPTQQWDNVGLTDRRSLLQSRQLQATQQCLLELGDGAMTSPESSGPDCWPDDQDYLYGHIRIFLPSQDGEEVGCYFDTTLLDLAGRSLSNQINVGEPFQVRFRAEARPGELWVDASGDWIFDLAFSPIGRGSGFNLSDLLPAPSVLKVGNWRGADTRCIEIAATVPPSTLPGSGGLYQVAATVAFQPTGGKIEPISGIEALESYSLQPQGGQRDQAERLSEAPAPAEVLAGRSVFVSYAHKDERYRQRLEISLIQLQRDGLITVWHDRKILPGQEWDQEIDRNLESAEIILLLVSPDFLGSKYAYGREMLRALERHQSRSATVVPIILRPSDWQHSLLAPLQALPSEGRPVARWSDRDQAWLDVAQGLRRLIQRQSLRTHIGITCR